MDPSKTYSRKSMKSPIFPDHTFLFENIYIVVNLKCLFGQQNLMSGRLSFVGDDRIYLDRNKIDA